MSVEKYMLLIRQPFDVHHFCIYLLSYEHFYIVFSSQCAVCQSMSVYTVWHHLPLTLRSFLQESSVWTAMAAAHWKPKSLDLGWWIILLLLNLLPEARYNNILYCTSQSPSVCYLTSSPTISFPWHYPSSWCSGDGFCIMPLLISLTAAADIVI